MRQLGEMDTEEPIVGSFSYFAYKCWGEFPEFLAGWNCWILYVMIGITELTAVAAYTHGATIKNLWQDRQQQLLARMQ